MEVEFDLQQGAVLARHPWTRVAWRRDSTKKTLARLYVAGQIFALPLADARTLAGAQALDGNDYEALSEDGRALVLELLAQGHYHLDDGSDEDFGEDDDDEA